MRQVSGRRPEMISARPEANTFLSSAAQRLEEQQPFKTTLASSEDPPELVEMPAYLCLGNASHRILSRPKLRALQEQSRRREVSGSRGRRGSALVARTARPAIIGPFRMTTRYPSGLFGRLWFFGARGPGWSGVGILLKTTTKFENLGSKESVDIVHSLRLKLPRTVLGLLRIPHVFVVSQCFQGLECSSSPTSGTVFSLFRGMWASGCLQISFMGPYGGPFLWVAAGLAAPSPDLDSGVAAYSFTAGRAWNCMTCCPAGVLSVHSCGHE
jgi:hypothetical protein